MWHFCLCRPGIWVALDSTGHHRCTWMLYYILWSGWKRASYNPSKIMLAAFIRSGRFNIETINDGYDTSVLITWPGFWRLPQSRIPSMSHLLTVFLIALNRAVPCRASPASIACDLFLPTYCKTRYNAALAVLFRSAVVLLPARTVMFSASV